MVDKNRMHKIAEMIKKDGLKPSGCSYHTWRDVLNKKKMPAGSIRILVKKGDTKACCEYICPECEHYECVEVQWKKPFSVKCGKCGFVINVPKLKAQIKKENKANKDKVKDYVEE